MEAHSSTAYDILTTTVSRCCYQGQHIGPRPLNSKTPNTAMFAFMAYTLNTLLLVIIICITNSTVLSGILSEGAN
jgi:hypothetical protein